MKIATWNVNGIRARHREVDAWAARERPDVFCLQEIRASTAQIPEPLTLLPDYVSFWHGGPGGYAGVSVHVRRGFSASPPRFTVPPFDVGCRVVEAAFDELAVASVYVPNGGKNYDEKIAFLNGLTAYAEERLASGTRLLLCGDLNVARSDADVHPRLRKPGSVGQSAEERALFAALLATGLADVVRERAPDDSELFTWWPPWREEKKKNRGWRIDYVLASAGLHAAGFAVLKDEGTSDHAPLLVDFARSMS